jgi:phosphatidylinositol-3-phosphatase
MRQQLRLVAAGLAACIMTACAPASSAGFPAASPAITPSSSPRPEPSATPAPTPTHVFVIVMENRSYSQLIGDAYIASLAAQYGVATNYQGVSHPSLPNYLALTSGSTWGITDDGFHALPAGGIGAQLTAAGIDWRAYMEGMTNGCFHSPYPYALKHNPFAYYGSACPAQVVSFDKFSEDLAGNTPRFAWITPDLCHDGHDCSNTVAEGWLAQIVPMIVGSDAWKGGGLLFITWDEGEDSSNSVLTLVIHPNPLVHQSGRPYNHYSMLATIEDQLGVERLGLAAKATPMIDLVAAAPVVPPQAVPTV